METTGFRNAIPLVVSGFILSFVLVGGGIDTVSVFLNAISQANDWSHSSLSLGIGVGAISAALVTPLVGMAVDRFGIRIPMTIGVALLGMGFCVLLVMAEPWHFAAANVFLGMGFGACAVLPITVAVTVFIPDRTALALGIISTGASTGALILAPVMQMLIDAYGWHATYRILGSAVVLTPIPLLLFTLPRGPLRKTGRTESGGQTTKKKTSIGHDLAQPDVAALTAVMVLPALVGFSIAVHLVPFLTKLGYSGTTAATALGGSIGISAVGKIAGGWIADRAGPVWTLRAAFMLWILALVFLTQASIGWALGLFVILYGLAFGTQIAVVPPIAVRLLNADRFGALFGILQLTAMLASAVGPVVSGIIFDRTGAYSGAVLLWLTAACLALLFAFSLQASPVAAVEKVEA